MYWLGQAVKKSYVDLDIKEYNFHNVELQSINSEHSIESALCFSQGFFGLYNGFKIESNDPNHFMPPIHEQLDLRDMDEFSVPQGVTLIPVESGDIGDDLLFRALDDCQYFKKKNTEYINK